MHQAAIGWDLTPLNWSGRVEVVSALDGRVVNKGVARYRQLEGRHLDPQGPRVEGVDVVALKTRTRQSRIEVAEAARTRVFSDGEELDVARSTYQTEDYVQQVLALDLHQGVTVRVEKNVALYSVARPRHQRAAGGGGQERGPVSRASTRRSTATPAPGTSSGRSATSRCRARSGSSSCCASTPPTCCRCARGRPPTTTPASPPAASTARRTAGTSSGTSSSPTPSSTSGCRRSPGGCCSTATGGSARPGTRPRQAGYRGAMYPWQSGSDGQEETQTVHLNPLSRQVGAGPQPQPAPRRRGDLLHRLAVPPGHGRPRLPARLGRRDDAGDRPLLGLDRALQPRPRPLGDPRGDGTGRVPRAVPGRHRGGPAQQRLHERDGGLDRRDRAAGARAAAGEPPRGAAQADRPLRRGDPHVAADEPPDVRPLPRGRGDQPVRGLRGPRGARLGRPAGPARQHPAARPDPAGRGRRPEPVQGGQAGRHPDAVLPLPGRRAEADLHAARVRPLPRRRPPDRSSTTTGGRPTARR